MPGCGNSRGLGAENLGASQRKSRGFAVGARTRTSTCTCRSSAGLVSRYESGASAGVRARTVETRQAGRQDTVSSPPFYKYKCRDARLAGFRAGTRLLMCLC